MSNKNAFWKPFSALLLVGMVGVLSLLLIVKSQMQELITAFNLI